MKYALGLAAAGALISATAQIDRPAAQTSSQPVAVEAAKSPLELSEQDKAAVIKAAIEAKSHQKTPKEYTPAVGEPLPTAVYRHSFKPEIAGEVPALKQYWYAHLDREIVLIDGQMKVAAVIPLPAKLVSGGQEHQGAATSSGESKGKPQDASTTGSVPAYTSPETIR